jgi:hypothetical protein
MEAAAIARKVGSGWGGAGGERLVIGTIIMHLKVI